MKVSPGRYQVVRKVKDRQAERVRSRADSTVDSTSSSGSEYDSEDEILEALPRHKTTTLEDYPRHQTQHASHSHPHDQVSIPVSEDHFESSVEVQRSRSGRRVSHHSSSSSSFFSTIFGSWSSTSRTSRETRISINHSEHRGSPKPHVPVHEPAKRERVRVVGLPEYEAIPVIKEEVKVERVRREGHDDFEEHKPLHRRGRRFGEHGKYDKEMDAYVFTRVPKLARFDF
ncbi:hypothetical protein PV10_07088 [Exophiala mesophila]|uniref:Uncharacterized protein n=1 Tax=Exophiala mesophila TaxID=212818 RepID=A0A0D1Z4J3_EXOME|nr:uncharacterized protein PV10_07088 [Exophiala mesophila]KIV89707.1 hypothetical protein PV10_07088 [Exophiala mesophila]